MTLQDVRFWLKEKLEGVTDEWEIESKWLLCHVLNCSVLDLVLYKHQEISESSFKELEDMVKRRQNREPIQYILGAHEFMGLPFEVSREVLIPRRETECLVDFIIEYVNDQPCKILDIGTGSGAISVSLAYYLKYSEVVTVDISANAIKVATENARLNGVEKRVRLIESNLFEGLSDEKFDIIVSNPPYIPEQDRETLKPEVADYEPSIALFGGLDGLDFYRRIIPDAKRHLNKKGMLIFETGHNQAEAVSEMLEKEGYRGLGSFGDLAGIQRFVYGHW